MVYIKRRSTSEKNISQIPIRTAAIVAEGTDIGPYSEHRVAQKYSFSELIVTNSARIIRVVRKLNGKRKYNYNFYIIGLACVIHGESTCIPVGTHPINRHYNPCLACVDDPAGDLALELDWDRDRVRKAFKRGETVEEIRKRESFRTSNKAVIRRPAPRRSQLPKDTSLEVRIQLKLTSYRESADPREMRLTKLLTTLNISQAVITDDDDPRRVIGLSCQVHPEIMIPSQIITGLLSGNNPCFSCQKENRCNRQISKSRPHKWTTSLLKERLANDFPPELEHLDFSSMVVETRQSLSYAVGIGCIIHDEVVPDVLVNQLFKCSVRCGSCPKKYAYSLEKIQEMVQFAHSGTIKLADYAGSVMGQSVFECLQCGHIWCTRINSVIGGKNKGPTGCPKCAKTHLVNEATVAHKLSDLYQEIICDHICMMSSGTFAQQVALPSNQKMSMDFLVGIPDLGTWAIEVDGPQHYGINFCGNDSSDAVERDTIKVKECANQGIKVARLPLPILPTFDYVFDELNAILAGQAKYQGIPQQFWIT
jgi:hypothetical protein